MSIYLSTWGYVLIALFIGVGAGVQLTMISAISRERGSVEAVWTSFVATGMIIVAFLLGKVLSNQNITLSQPFQKPILLVIILVFFILALIFATKGLNWYFALTGILAVPLLVGAGLLGPKMGIGVYISATIAGQLIGSIFVDHIGAFGGVQIAISFQRIIGAVLLIIGVILVRGLR